MKRPFYLIAHRCNEPSIALEAVREGANAIECDISLDGLNYVVQHDGITEHPYQLKSYLQQLTAIAHQHTSIVLVIFDCKFNQASRVRGLLSTIRSYLTNAVPLYVLISISDYDDRKFFLPLSGYLDENEAVGIDFDNDPDRVASFFLNAGFNNCAFGNGMFIDAAGPNVSKSLMTAVSLKTLHQNIKFTYVWTLDRKTSMRNYLRMGVDGILVNNVPKLYNIITEESEFNSKIRLATRSDNPFAETQVKSYVDQDLQQQVSL